jgi:hypothetical protein
MPKNDMTFKVVGNSLRLRGRTEYDQPRKPGKHPVAS